VVVRLKRAGISTAKISILNPQSLSPNSARCWINGSALLALTPSQSVSVSGMLSGALNSSLKKNQNVSFSDRMGKLGLGHEQCSSLENSLLESRIVIAVEVDDEYELPAIYHTLRGLDVQRVNISDVAHKGALASTRSHRYHPEFAPVAFAMGYGHAA
jgi:hypothetical protein